MRFFTFYKKTVDTFIPHSIPVFWKINSKKKFEGKPCWHFLMTIFDSICNDEQLPSISEDSLIYYEDNLIQEINELFEVDRMEQETKNNSNQKLKVKNEAIKEKEEKEKLLKGFSMNLFPKWYLDIIINMRKDDLFNYATNTANFFHKKPPGRIQRRFKKVLYSYIYHTFKDIYHF